ncbi:MAG: heavy metal-binding domain-containing protein [Chloroflexi bacterium]|nr:heavy metal-binding domain-containing protein [Chloroflexota bacterium]
MIIATIDAIEGKRTLEVYGLVFGREPSPDPALARMVQSAEEMGANAVVGVRFASGPPGVLAYGTAVRVEQAAPG